MQRTLYHEIFDNSMKDGAFVALRNAVLLEFTRAQLAEILGGFRTQIRIQFKQHPTQRRVAHRHVKEHHRIVGVP